MSTRLTTITFDAVDAPRLAAFWASALGWTLGAEQRDGEVVVSPTDGTPFDLSFFPVPEAKSAKNRLHLDLISESVDDQAAMVDRLVELGASRVDVGQGDDATWVVLADPDGNELCVVVRGDFLATVESVLGAVVFEPASYPDVGRFWSAATGWPIVHDEDGDMAIRHPSGTGPFITFGPPTGAPKSAKNRIHLDVAPGAIDDHAAEVERLLALGGRRVDVGQGDDVTWVVLADPDGNELCVLSPRLAADEAGPFFHGTKADLRPGDLLVPGHRMNLGEGRVANHVYVSASMDAATWGAELAAGDAPGRIYRVEPTGQIEDDPNLTDKRFPGNPTRSYRTREPVRVVEEVVDWEPHAPEVLQAMRDGLADLRRRGLDVILD